jgi:inorganic pyrophosphatase
VDSGFVGSEKFFISLEKLTAENGITIDRPKGFAHPRVPALIYPMDYGYINGTQSQDGHGIDVYCGDDPSTSIAAVICTVDMIKKDAEIKVLYRCSEENIQTAMKMSNNGPMSGILVRRTVKM